MQLDVGPAYAAGRPGHLTSAPPRADADADRSSTRSDVTEFSIAIVHDYLNQRGGAERVVLEIADMWPQAPIYTSLYRPESTFPGFRRP